jgi:hypothetical protein
LLAHRPEDRLRTAGRLVRLAERYTPQRLERACQRAQAFGAADFTTIKRILVEGLDQQPIAGVGRVPGTVPLTQDPVPLRAYAFVRQASEFVSALFGGVR